MLKKEIKVLLFGLTLLLGACCSGESVTADYGVVPLPQQIELKGDGAFVLSSSTVINYDGAQEELKRVAELFAEDLAMNSGYLLTIADKVNGGDISLSIDSSIKEKEGYVINVTSDGIDIKGADAAGVYHAAQTIRKSIPAFSENSIVKFPAVTINDYPRFSYRGMMLDVSRHFQPVDSVKSVIDMLAFHNLNTLHMHLTDDQGWRVEIKKYPKLTTVGSKRAQTVIGRNSGEYDGKPYSGFYTQEQLKELVAYAAERYITIVPEIDLPGHQLAALAAYPELGCTGGPYKVWEQWGVSDDVICAGNDKAMEFLEDVLAEVIEIFPSEYIHVGGDECPKSRWAKCPKCQARIKSEGIKGDSKHSATEYLQSYVISRMERFVESKGRHIIGWDEILEGGLAPNATVMSWRGIQGGIQAAKEGHDVIMTPTSNMYFDYYQSAQNELEPLAIGGYLPVSQVYAFEPVPESLTAEEAKYVIGTQGNLWCEYVPTFSHLMYMTLPRLTALSEVQWLDKDKKNYEDFLARCARMTDLYSQYSWNFAKHIFDVNAILTPDTEKGVLVATLKSFGDGDIHYTLDGSEPTVDSPIYNAPIEIDQNCEIKAVVVRKSGNSRVFSESVKFSKSSMKPITLKYEPDEAYKFNGALALVDALKGGANYKTGRWLGFTGKDVIATIDLKELTEISRVAISTDVVKGDWIMDARGLKVKVSEDGKNFKEVASKDIDALKKNTPDGVYNHSVEFDALKTRFVEITILNKDLPSWHSGAGSPAYIFVDEISID